MKFTLFLSLLVSASLFASTPKFDNTRLFIMVKDGANVPSSNLIKSTKHLFGNHYIVQTTDAVKLEAILKKNLNVTRTEKNYFAGITELPKLNTNKSDQPFFTFGAFNDPKVGNVWSFNDASNNGVSVDKSYLAPLGIQKENIIVAVVDTGVDYNHEDLKNIMWKNVNEIADNGIDDDQNGYVDDIFGIDTLTKDSQGNATGDPMASHAHGTHVSGTIAAEQNNMIGMAGIANKAKIMAIRTVPDNADETDADVVESFLYAAKHGARLINCSFGKKHNEGGMIVNDTINHIGKNFDVLVFAAAGNDYGRNIDNVQAFPASFDSDYLLVVASTTSKGRLSWFSNIGPKSVDVAAPGSDIYSTMPGNGYGNMSGTSMATPTTVGVAAEVLSHFPELSPLQLKKVLMEGVTTSKALNGKMVSGGRVDLFNSLQFVLNNYNTL